jgi:hypothetical protein
LISNNKTSSKPFSSSSSKTAAENKEGINGGDDSEGEDNEDEAGTEPFGSEDGPSVVHTTATTKASTVRASPEQQQRQKVGVGECQPEFQRTVKDCSGELADWFHEFRTLVGEEAEAGSKAGGAQARSIFGKKKM